MKLVEGLAMKKMDVLSRIIETLIENGVLSFRALRNEVRVRSEDLEYLLRDLEFLNIVNARKDKIYLSSHAYSLLFDPVIASRGLTDYIQRSFQNGVVKETKNIPGLLVPILLMRAANPYIGLIIRDLKKNNEIELDQKKVDFLLAYFGQRKVDYASLKDWKNIDFDLDEFYDLWMILNRELSIRVKTSTDSVLSSRIEPSPLSPQVYGDTKFATKTKSSLIDSVAVQKISESALMKSALRRDNSGVTQIRRAKETIPSDLRRIKEIEVSLPTIVSFVENQRSNTEGLTINVFGNAIKWEFVGKRAQFPALFLMEDGIYIEEQTKREFSKEDIDKQARYLESQVLISKTFPGPSEKSTEGREKDE